MTLKEPLLPEASAPAIEHDGAVNVAVNVDSSGRPPPFNPDLYEDAVPTAQMRTSPARAPRYGTNEHAAICMHTGGLARCDQCMLSPHRLISACFAALRLAGSVSKCTCIKRLTIPTEKSSMPCHLSRGSQRGARCNVGLPVLVVLSRRRILPIRVRRLRADEF